jgi:hypothetical protein
LVTDEKRIAAGKCCRASAIVRTMANAQRTREHPRNRKTGQVFVCPAVQTLLYKLMALSNNSFCINNFKQLLRDITHRFD